MSPLAIFLETFNFLLLLKNSDQSALEFDGILFIGYMLQLSDANLNQKQVVLCTVLGPLSIFLASFIILFYDWACQGGFVQTLVKNTHDEILIFPPGF